MTTAEARVRIAELATELTKELIKTNPVDHKSYTRVNDTFNHIYSTISAKVIPKTETK
jgi:hypothetical protein